MATRAHMVKVVKEGAELEVPDPAGVSGAAPQTDGIEFQTSLDRTGQSGPKVSRKTLSLLIVASIVLASAGIYWAIYLRPWSMHEVENNVIADPTVATPGFSHSLAGKTVTVEGKVTSVESKATNRGQLIQVWLDSDNISLVYWGSEPYKVGDHARQAVHFEWAFLNDERHVCSPQLDFPWIVLLGIGPVINSVSVVSGSVLYPEEVSEHQIRINVFDQYPSVRTEGANCTLSKGETSWARNYLEALGCWGYGTRLGFVPDLSTPVAGGGRIVFSDSDHDGNLSAGDWFDLSGIERPAAEAGINTYMMFVGRPQSDLGKPVFPVSICYFAVGHAGLIGILSETPYARLAASNQTPGIAEATFVKVSSPFDWSNLTIVLSGDNAYIKWHPNSTELTGEFMADFQSQQIGSLTVSCTVGDELGNGLVDVGDWIRLEAHGGSFPSGTNYTLGLIWEPLETQFGSWTFHG